MEEIVFLPWILHISVDQQGVGFRVDVFNGNLKTIEKFGLRVLYLRNEVLGQFLDR